HQLEADLGFRPGGGQAGVEALLAKRHARGRRLGAEGQVVERGEPGLRLAALGFHGAAVALPVTELDERLQRLQRGIAAGQGDQDRLAAAQAVALGENRLGVQGPPVGLEGRFHRAAGVAPPGAAVAAAGAHEHRGHADQRALALDGRAEDLADGDHGRYSAQVLGVSDTDTALTSGQRARAQSYRWRARRSAVTHSSPSTSLRWRWSRVSSM